MKRRLILRAEALTDLELEGVTGGEQLTPQCASTPIKTCVIVTTRTTAPIECVVSWPCAEITGT